MRLYDESSMTKYLCDLCKKDMAGNKVMMVRNMDFGIYKEYCLSCFQDPKNWKKIHTISKSKSASYQTKPHTILTSSRGLRPRLGGAKVAGLIGS